MGDLTEAASYIGTLANFIMEARNKIAASPEDDILKLQLCYFLLQDGQFEEAASIGTGILLGCRSHHAGPETEKQFAYRTVASATRRAKSLFEDAARLIPGEDAFEATMEMYELILRDLDEAARS